MLRRVARALRVALFVFGIALCASNAISYWYTASVTYGRAGRWYGIHLLGGAVVMWTTDIEWQPGLRFESHGYGGSLSEFSGSFWPAVHTLEAVHGLLHFIKFPLWLLAAVCLAWPVTSFIVACRKRRRGFPVEPSWSDGAR